MKKGTLVINGRDYSNGGGGLIEEVQLSTKGASGNAIKFGYTEDGRLGYFKPGAAAATPFGEGGTSSPSLVSSLIPVDEILNTTNLVTVEETKE